jgi:hypothetical protein
MPYGVQVNIANQMIEPGYDPDNPATVVVDGLSITWGRDDVYADVTPAQLSLSLIDPDGDFGDNPGLIGTPVTVIRTGGVGGAHITFQGRITDATMTAFETFSPEDGQTRTLFRVDLTASDPLADLARMKPPGDVTTTFNYGTLYGPGSWNSVPPTNRITQIMNTGGAGLLIGAIEAPANYVPGQSTATYTRFLALHAADDNPDLLTLLVGCYRVDPLVHVNYLPESNTIIRGVPASPTAIALVLSGTQIVMSYAGGLTLDANTVEVPDGLSLASASAIAIDSITMSAQFIQTVPDGQPISGTQYYKQVTGTIGFAGNTAHYNPAQYGVRTLDAAVDAAGQSNTYNGTETGMSAWRYLVAQLVTFANSFNGLYQLPTLRYDFKRFDPAPPNDIAANTLLVPYDQNIALIFPGSVFEGLLEVASQHQLIGGTISYIEGGWISDMTVVPIIGGSGGTLTIGQLVTNPTPLMGDYANGITLGDLGTVTIGLS